MSFSDLFALILYNLGRRIGRVALTAVGVIIGTAAIVVLVSLAIGLQQSANEQLFGIGDLTLITVEPNYGEFAMMGAGPGSVIVESVPGSSNPPPNQTLITNQSLADLTALPGVKRVIARDWMQAGGTLTFNRLESYPSITGVNIDDLSQMDLEPQGGTLKLERGTAVIGSMVAMNFYDPRLRPGQEPPPPPELLDQNVKLILSKWNETTQTETRRTVPIRIVGVIAESKTEADWTFFMTMQDVTTYNEWAFGRRINRNRDGYPNVWVKAENIDVVLDLTDQINALGDRAYTNLEYVQGINSFYVILQVVFGGIGAISLLVAAIGIANTMAMAILERTREIGLMKAVGATNRDVLSVFLGEAAGIGFIGGLGGVLLGWSAGQLINVLAVAYLARQSVQTGAPPPTTAVITPSWLPIFALLFATIIGLVSGLYPALRAATLIPVTALKYE